MEKIIVLEIKYQYEGKEECLYPVVLKDEKNMVLIDCGYPGFLPLIEQEMTAKGLDVSQLTHILITHHDHDHMGTAFEIVNKYPQIKFVSSVAEEPYISGRRKSLRLEQAERMQEGLTEEQRQFGNQFCEILRAVKPVEVDITAHDGEIMDWCGGCTILDTSGHTQGHISVYLNQHKIMITGDAAVVENEALVVANPQFAYDLKKAEEALHKLISYGAEEFICYHGGIWRQS